MHGRIRTWGPGALVLLPTVLLLGYFVYGLIAWTFNTSLTDKHNARPVPTNHVGFENYVNLFGEERFLNSLKNLGVLTVAFIVGTLIFGLIWALLLEKGVPGEGIFRSVFLFPMAVSMIASGVVWGWLLNPSQGDDARGLNRLFSILVDRGVALDDDGLDRAAGGLAAVRLHHGAVPGRVPGHPAGAA
jgi:glucose/mannose transport system permease protein